MNFAGEMVQRERDKTVELEFNRLLDSVSHLSHHLQVDQLGGEPLSLGQALELVIQYVKSILHTVVPGDDEDCSQLHSKLILQFALRISLLNLHHHQLV